MKMLALWPLLVLLIVLVPIIWSRIRKRSARDAPPGNGTARDTAWVDLPPVRVQDMISGQIAADAIASGRIGDDALQATISSAFPEHPETAFAVFVRLRALYFTLDKMVELSLSPGLSAEKPDLLALAASERVVLIDDTACFDPELFATHLRAREQ